MSDVPLLPPFNPVTLLIDIVGMLIKLIGFGGDPIKPVREAVKTTWTNLVLTTGFLYNTTRSILDFLGKLLKIIAQVQAWYIKYIYRYVKMVEDIISRIRVVLSLFRLLGIKWAAKLDADLARIQGYLTTALQAIVGTLNTVSTWLTLITDPAGIIRKDFFTGTLFSSLGAVKRAANFGQDRALSASEAQATDEDMSLAKGGQAVLTQNADGSVSLSSASQRIKDAGVAAHDYYQKEYAAH
jgi:hypothetical protein